jgi:Nucleotidyl transferase AbiEii toxin, Type IV TA system
MRYVTANAFRTALETRLRTRSSETGRTFPQLRNEIVYNRLLARLLLVAPDRWVLKGAMALDLRLGAAARPTKDMDLGREDDIASATADMEAVEAVVADFLDPLLSANPLLAATWNPVQQRWLMPDEQETPS